MASGAIDVDVDMTLSLFHRSPRATTRLMVDIASSYAIRGTILSPKALEGLMYDRAAHVYICFLGLSNI